MLLLERVVAGAVRYPIGLKIVLRMENSRINQTEKLTIGMKVTDNMLRAGYFTS